VTIGTYTQLQTAHITNLKGFVVVLPTEIAS